MLAFLDTPPLEDLANPEQTFGSARNQVQVKGSFTWNTTVEISAGRSDNYMALAI